MTSESERLTFFGGLKVVIVVRSSYRGERREIFFPARTGLVRCRAIEVNYFDENVAESEPDKEAVVLIRVVQRGSRNTGISIVDHDSSSRDTGVDLVEHPQAPPDVACLVVGSSSRGLNVKS